jgi:hypothetical protein
MPIMKFNFAPLVLVLAGVLFLVPSVKLLAKGESLVWSPSLATAIGFFLGAIVSVVVGRKSGGGPRSPGG